MADVITGLIGAVIMIGFVSLIAAKLNELPLWIVCIAGIVLMLWAVATDTILPLFGRNGSRTSK
jgi:hypothetical protein